MLNEREELIALEEQRFKYTILASNPQLYQAIFEREEEEEEEWRTPTSVEEMKDVMELFDQVEGDSIPKANQAHS